MAKDIPYNIGLDIGTSSIGWAITDENNRLVSVKGHYGIGTRLFKEGESAAERRGFRTTRRRLSRRKWRLRLLSEIFDAPIAEVDQSFYARLRQSSVSPLDPNKKHEFAGNILFDDADFTDQDYHHQYPTIYHLRHDLATKNQKFDVRLIYLALHHLIKYRGHFLNKAAADKFKVGDIDLSDSFQQLNEIFVRQQRDGLELKTTADVNQLVPTLIDTNLSKSDRQKQIAGEIFVTGDKDQNQANKKVATELLKAILGLKAKFNVIFGIQDVTNANEFSLTFNSDDFDDKIMALGSQITDEDQEILAILQKLYFAVDLAGILQNPADGSMYESVSAAMIGRYEQHHRDLARLKRMAGQLKQAGKKQQAKALKQSYADYVDGEISSYKKIPWDEFTKRVKKQLDDSELANEIETEIDKGQFMPKQRSKENGAIPYQLQQQELDAIIENQGRYYPWLLKEKDHLDALISFRVPYYVGPMVDPEEVSTVDGKFAWMKRKEQGEIKPWNFEEKVDKTASATNFIKRMTATDTYLIGAPVLPKNSLLYQEFTVLNELNKLKVNVNGNKVALSPDYKQAIFNQVYKKHKRVSLKRLNDFMQAQGWFSTDAYLSGTTDQKNVNNTLGTYNDFKGIFGDQLDDPNRQADLERIIEWSTIFEDGHIFKLKLDTIDWLTQEQKERLVKHRYQGWGRLSKQLLAGITNANGERVIDVLWNTQQNLMETLADDSFKEAIQEFNGKKLDKQNVSDIIVDLYTSPQNKKAIRQVLLVVDDIEKAMGHAPANIMIEFAREDRKDHRLINSRSWQLNQMFEKAKDEVSESVQDELKDKIKDKAQINDRLYLYFVQGGKDLYSGEPLDIDRLSQYDIDHILPQSFILDNSLDNRILTSQSNNRAKKADQLPGEIFGPKMKGYWNTLREHGLMTWKKYNNLMLTPDKISKFDNQGRFINRQLVETRQVIKLVAEILQNQYGNDKQTNIVTIKADLTHHMRTKFNFYKNRNVNDYHHAFDAYLSAFVGNWLLQQYPKLKPYFVYGDFAKAGIKDFKQFNFLYRFEKEHAVAEDGTIKNDSDQLLGYMRKVYQLKKMLVTKELETNHGNLFDQTLRPSPFHDAKVKGTRKLVNIKENRPSSIYGGYSGQNISYMSLVKYKKEKIFSYKLIGIPLTIVNKLDSDNLIYKFLQENFTSKNGKKTEFTVIQKKVFINQLIRSDRELFRLGSSSEKHNASQLVISDDVLKTLNSSIGSLSKEYLKVSFKKIIRTAYEFMPMYKLDNVDNIIESFESIEDKNEMLKLINGLLIGLHANASRSNLAIIGLSSTFGRFNCRSGITFNANDEFIYQSPTGLFSRKVKISDL
ncbi:type II CRISPR RNA-guided endonuclease Cas9 [Fructilactobacillus cliffordii]|uniref:type II CRISPR RNA-guided endonuclease Cas9 n=1 Tax=Fructilactobacillus cliffordii TaxID=2940299 RepID=UPI0020939BED|nr:type II CRISPR RNA-guided endonuclease Cas9 [Fructilactobacillus cliffordii]USS87121.1 type II CRISPR RNA-guided endonuclease Cas9 [Fructilactobacillus cliffordii]